MFDNYLYLYSATCTAVYDGDTITVDIDLGFGNIMQGQKLRLYCIDAPEMRGAEKAAGKVTRDWLRARILGKKITIRTFKDKTGKYGRWLAEVFGEDEEGRLTNLNLEMVRLGLAEENFYK